MWGRTGRVPGDGHLVATAIAAADPLRGAIAPRASPAVQRETEWYFSQARSSVALKSAPGLARRQANMYMLAVAVRVLSLLQGGRMVSADNAHEAGASATGYLFQCRYALLAGLRAIPDSPQLELSIEKFDDVAFTTGGEPTELIQTKHHV